MKKLYVSLLILFSCIIIVSAITLDFNSGSYNNQQILNVSNRSDTFFYLGFNNGTTFDENISKFSPNNQTGTLNRTNPLQLFNQNISSGSLVVVQPGDLAFRVDDSNPTTAINISGLDVLVSNNRSYSFFFNVSPNQGSGNVNRRGNFLSFINNESVFIMDTLRIGITNNGGAIVVNGSNNAFNPGVWTHIAVTINESNFARIYVNGTLYASGLLSNIGPGEEADTNTYIGNSEHLTNPINGSIRNVLVYRKILDLNEINAIRFNNGLRSWGASINHTNTNTLTTTYNNGTVINVQGNNVSISLNNGTTFTNVSTIASGANLTGGISIWDDSLNNTWFVSWNTGGIWRSNGTNLNQWSNPINMSCDNSTSAPRPYGQMGFTEGANGDVYIGTYVLSGNNNEMCGKVYKVTSNLSAYIFYNDSTAETRDTYRARHTHFVQCDPYSNYCYISLGDGEYARQLMMFNKNGDGSDMRTIRVAVEDGFSWQPTAIIFTPQYVILGEDVAPQSTRLIPGIGYGRGIRQIRNASGVADFSTFEYVFNKEWRYSGFLSNGIIDNVNRSYMMETVVGNETEAVIVGSNDGWNSSRIIQVVYGTPTTALAGYGWNYPSAPDSNGVFYVSFNSGPQFYPNTTRLTPFNEPSDLYADWKLNHNGGSVIYDTSGNSRNGQITGTPAWSNSSCSEFLFCDKMLNNGVDFVLNKSAGTITLVNQDYEHSYVSINYDFYTWRSIYDSLKVFYTFDVDNSSTAFDQSMSGNNGARQSGITTNTSGGFAGTRAIEGEGDFASRTTLPYGQYANLTNNNITFSAWVRGSKKPYGGLFSSVSLARHARFWFGRIESTDGLLNFCVSNNSEFNQCVQSYTPLNLVDNEWSHFVNVMYQKNGVIYVKPYVNGQPGVLYNLSVSGSISNQTGEAPLLGRYHGWASWNGTIDEVMIFNTQLNDQQVKSLYQNTSARFRPSANIYQTNNTQINNSNSINASLNYIYSPSNSSIGLLFRYFDNGNWFNTLEQNITLVNSNYTFTIPSTTTNISYNVSLRSSPSRYMTPYLKGDINYGEWLLIPDITNDCSIFTTTGYLIILLFTALALPIAVLYFIDIDDFEGIDLKSIIPIGIAIIVGVILFIQIAQNLGSACS